MCEYSAFIVFLTMNGKTSAAPMREIKKIFVSSWKCWIVWIGGLVMMKYYILHTPYRLTKIVVQHVLGIVRNTEIQFQVRSTVHIFSYFSEWQHQSWQIPRGRSPARCIQFRWALSFLARWIARRWNPHQLLYFSKFVISVLSVAVAGCSLWFWFAQKW